MRPWRPGGFRGVPCSRNRARRFSEGTEPRAFRGRVREKKRDNRSKKKSENLCPFPWPVPANSGTGASSRPVLVRLFRGFAEPFLHSARKRLESKRRKRDA